MMRGSLVLLSFDWGLLLKERNLRGMEEDEMEMVMVMRRSCSVPPLPLESFRNSLNS